MCYEDFVKYFHAVNVCMVRHIDYHPEPWLEKRSRFNYVYQAGAEVPDSQRKCTLVVVGLRGQV